MMERRAYEEVSVVSERWTPEHLDVTHVPYTYARPKPAWIDGYERLRPLIATDADERMARRRAHSGGVVDGADVGLGEPLDARPVRSRRAR